MEAHYAQIPSLSIVLGLMLVFRNQTSYSRFWDGRNYLTTVITSVRNLTRSFLTSSYNHNKHKSPTRGEEHADTERAVKCVLAILFATRNHLRADWGAFSDLSPQGHQKAFTELSADFEDLRPPGLIGYSHKGLGVTLEFCALVEQYIQRGITRGWWFPPQASQLTAQVNNIVDAYGKMETIRLTPVPIAHLYVMCRGFGTSSDQSPQNPPETSACTLWHDAPLRYGQRVGMVGNPDYDSSHFHALRDRRHCLGVGRSVRL